MSRKYDIFDDVPLTAKLLLMILCGIICCWGFVTNAILLVFGSKIGFPIPVALCAISNNKKQVFYVTAYTIGLVLVGFIYFSIQGGTIDPATIVRYGPSITDFIIALGIGLTLSYFWNHLLRTNSIVMCAGVASLLPACIMTGYHLHTGNIPGAIDSIMLYFEYVVGISLGVILLEWLGVE